MTVIVAGINRSKGDARPEQQVILLARARRYVSGGCQARLSRLMFCMDVSRVVARVLPVLSIMVGW